MQSDDNKIKKNIQIKTEPKIEMQAILNPLQGSSSSQLELDSGEVDQDFWVGEPRNKIRGLEEENSSQLPMLSNNIFAIKTEPTTSSLDQETNAFNNIKDENEDYTSISPRRSRAQSSSSRSHSSYSESVASVIPCVNSVASQPELSLGSDPGETSEEEKRGKTLTVQLKNGELVVLTNSRKARWTVGQKNKSEFQLYENQVELWENFTGKIQDKLKGYNSEEFQKAIKDKCRKRETLGIKLNNRERVVLNHNKARAWNKFTEEEKDELQKLGEKEFFRKINKKLKEDNSLEITLTSGSGNKTEVTLYHTQITAWHRLIIDEKHELLGLEEQEFFKEINKKVKEGNSIEITLTSGSDNKTVVILYSTQAKAWKKLAKKEQDELLGLKKEEFFKEINKKRKEGNSIKITLTSGRGNKTEVTLHHSQAAAWNKLNKEKKNELLGLEEQEFFKEINKKVKEGNSIEITLTSGRGNKTEVTLVYNQTVAWKKFTKKEQDELLGFEKEEFFKEINKKVKEGRSLEIIFESGEKTKISPSLVPLWRRLDAEEQKLRKAGNAQALIRKLKDMYNQAARIRKSVVKKTPKPTRETNLVEISSASQASYSSMADETVRIEEDLATSEAFEDTDEYKREAVKRKRITEDDSPIVTQEYNHTPYKKRKIYPIYPVKEEPREIYEEGNNININNVPSELNSVTVVGAVVKSKEEKVP